MAKSLAFNVPLDSCLTCSSKYNRVRSALCECKHCSKSFCFDCMKDHNDELQQNIAQVSNRYNELKLLINSQQKLITDETAKSKKQMSEWLQKYIDNLTAEKVRIDADIDNTEKDAQKFIDDIESQVQTVRSNIERFTKTNCFQSTHIEKVLEKLDELTQRISNVSIIREYDLPSTMPKYKFGFNYYPKSTTDEISHAPKPTTNEISHAPKPTTDEISHAPKCNEKPTNEEQNQSDSFMSETESCSDEDSDTSFPDENYFCNRDKFESTSYVINCMASDGIDIMYSTIQDPQHDIIAYCYLDESDCNYRQPDPYRPWLLSSIVDMIWWESIDKFVCGTNNGIVTVEYLNKRFKILTVINNRWTNVRIASNTNYLWIYEKGKIMIYNVNFELVQSINFRLSSPLKLASFCITDNTVAVALIRRVKNDRDILQIEFYDCNMNKGKRVCLGLSETSCTIRTDGNDLFYIAMGQQRFHIVSSNGNKQTINLGKQANNLAVVNSRNVVLTKSRSELELVRC